MLGAIGTLLGQHLALRVDVRRDAAERAANRRAERKDAIIGFLSAAERTEQYRRQSQADRERNGTDFVELLHAAWLAKKIIELVCSGELAQAAQDYVRELESGCQEFDRNVGSAAFSVRERQLRAEFMELARREMGYQGEPMQHRKYGGHEQPGPATSLTEGHDAARAQLPAAESQPHGR